MFLYCKLNSKPIILSKQKLQTNYVLIGLSSYKITAFIWNVWHSAEETDEMFRICLLIMEWSRVFGQYWLSFRGWIAVRIVCQGGLIQPSSAVRVFMTRCLEVYFLIHRSRAGAAARATAVVPCQRGQCGLAHNLTPAKAAALRRRPSVTCHGVWKGPVQTSAATGLSSSCRWHRWWGGRSRRGSALQKYIC